MTAVYGFATSHSPMLSTAPEYWVERTEEDRKNKALLYRGTSYDFPGVVAARQGEDFEKAASAEGMQLSYKACQEAIATLATRFEEAQVDRAIIIGNDHKESFSDECFAAVTVFAGGSIWQVPFTAETIPLMVPGTERAREGHTPPQPVSHPGDPALADGLIAWLNDAEFDVARSTILPPGKYSNRSIPHAFGFPYRRVMRDRVVPNVPVFINTFYPPNIMKVSRCIRLGTEIGRYVAGLDDGKNTAVLASGGLSHFVVEADLDRFVLDAMAAKDLDALGSLDEAVLESGTAEIRSWIVMGAAMIELGLEMEVVDYVPAYRSEAGTGVGMGFVTWK